MMRVLLSIITILLVAGGILAVLLALTNDAKIVWFAVYAFSGAMASGFAASVLYALEQQLEATDRLRNDVLAALKKLQKS